tara:strand:+ start:1017 stop:1214 length:198 start_codon:yes stop_codon:yes gene_type:complete
MKFTKSKLKEIIREELMNEIKTYRFDRILITDYGDEIEIKSGPGDFVDIKKTQLPQLIKILGKIK